jgi:hypothetical protein
MSKRLEVREMSTIAIVASDLDHRVAAAFGDRVRSSEVADLIVEAEAAAVAAGETAERARSRALDPALSAPDVAAARREMDDAAFRRDRLQVAAKRLGERLREVRAQEENSRRQLAYDKARVERDELAAELARVYPPLAAQLADLMALVFANDREVEHINAHVLPRGAERLLVAELVARGLRGFVENSIQTPRITEELRVPTFQFDRTEPYAWPRARPSLLIASPRKGQAAA